MAPGERTIARKLAEQGLGGGTLGKSAKLDAPPTRLEAEGAGGLGVGFGVATATWAGLLTSGFGSAFALVEFGLEVGAGAAFALASARATPFLRSSSGMIWSSWASVSLAAGRPCAAARLI